MGLVGEDLERLLAPRSLAVVGARRYGERVVEQTRRLGFAGPVHAVHPSGPVGDAPTVARVPDLPSAPDLAFVAVPHATAPATLAQLADLGCGAAVVYSSGFAEHGRAELQRELVTAAGGMPFLGPNCYGLLNYVDGVAVWPDQHGGRRLGPGERGVALVSQSSSIAISLTMVDTGLPIAHVATVGNGAVLGAAALAGALVPREEVSAVGLLVESLADVRGLESLAASAREHNTPVVALVLGRSEQAQRVVVSHSGSMASDAVTGSDFLRRLGIGEVSGVDSLLGALSLLHCGGPLPGGELTSLSSSGGEASLIADLALGRTVGFARLRKRDRARLADALGPRVDLDNPLDYHTYIWPDPDAMTAAFTAMCRVPADLHLLYADLPRTDRCDDSEWAVAVDAFAAALSATGARGAIVAAMAGNLQGPRPADWVRRGLACLAPPTVALDAAEVAYAIGRAWAAARAEPIVGPSSATRARVLSEPEGKALLSSAGVAVPPGGTVDSAGAAGRLAAEIGYPVVVKGVGAAHKSDAGLVRLGLADGEAVEKAAAELLARCDGVLVESMVPGALLELLVSVDQDPTFGPVLTLGWGGVHTELVRDVVRRVLPVTRADLAASLRALRCWPILAGHRGAPPADLDSVLDAVEAICRTIGGPVRSIEVNPLLVSADAVMAVDALVTLIDPEEVP